MHNFPAIASPSPQWAEGAKATFDLETTGPDPFTAKIVTASILVTDAEGNVIDSHEWLINPGVDIPEGAAAVHGITTEMAQKEGSDPVQGLFEINQTLAHIWAQGIPVVVYNASYDFTVLVAEGAERSVAAVTPRFVIDPYILDKQMDPYRPGKRTLEAATNHYGIILDNAHTSAADARATVELAEALLLNYPELDIDLRQLYALQQKWAQEQGESLQKYFDQKGRQENVNTQWPIRTIT